MKQIGQCAIEDAKGFISIASVFEWHGDRFIAVKVSNPGAGIVLKYMRMLAKGKTSTGHKWFNLELDETGADKD